MKNVLLYAMTGSKMCFMHVLLNALDVKAAGGDAKIIFEGESVKLVGGFEEEKHPLYLKAKEQGLLAGICLACSKTLGVYEANLASGLPMLDEMNGHAGFKSYLADGWEIVSI
ncbi:MAG TPA: hypothetical protein VFC80_03215 [Sphaerochaeta sp.]|nr:hypothetical protein [Sphaerochaeta sp.]